ncbi:hypothetical protein MPER_04346, partial [Moniliophthora perniciosa FA553]
MEANQKQKQKGKEKSKNTKSADDFSSLEDLRSKFQRWFYNHQGDVSKASISGYEPYFAALNEASERPRRRQDHKFYMTHPDHAEKVKTEFEKEIALKKEEFVSEDFQHPMEGEDDLDNPAEELDVDEDEQKAKNKWLQRHSLSIRCSVARRLFEKERKEERDRLISLNDIEYLKAIKEYDKHDAVEACDNSEEAQKLRRNNASTIAYKFVNEFSRLTGFKCVMLMGSPPETGSTRFPMTSVESDEGPGGKKWKEWAPQAFMDNVLGHFFGYLQAMDEERKKDGRSTPSTAPST